MFDDLRRRLADRGMTLEVSRGGAEPHRPSRGTTRCTGPGRCAGTSPSEVETRIARALLRDAVPDGATIRLDVGEGGELVVSHEVPAGAAA